QVLLPQGVRPVGQRVAAPHAVDQDVQPSVLLRRDLIDQRTDLLRAAVVDADRDTCTAGCSDLISRLLDGLRTVQVGTTGRAAAAGNVHSGTRDPEFNGDSPPSASGASCDQGDLPGKRLFVVGHDSSAAWPYRLSPSLVDRQG